MKIDAESEYAGLPLLRVRKLLKAGSHSFGWTAAFAARILQVDGRKAARVIRKLADDRYIERAPKEYGGWRNTENGNALGNASAAKLLHRVTAEKRLNEFLDRVRFVNSPECPFLHVIETVVLFGSVLTDKQRVSDIDVSFPMVRKPVADYVQAGQERVRAARAQGRRFSGFMDELGWPELEVLLFLRNRSRSLSFIRWDEEWMAKQPHKAIYRRSDG